MNPLTLAAWGVVLPAMLWSTGPIARRETPPASLPDIVFNDNREPAGTLSGGALDLTLEVREGRWHLLGDSEPAARVLAFAEPGKAPSIPGPLIRVPLGTRIHVTVTNPLDTAIVIHGLGARRGRGPGRFQVPAGSTREAEFTADAAGTYFYWGAVTDGPIQARDFEDSQLSGALVVDAPGAPTDDRILMIGIWYRGSGPRRRADFGGEYAVINGRPWPFTERLTYAMGDSIRWRLINTSSDTHAMHLHGFYYRVDARGDIARDTIYWERERRMAVTERMLPGSTLSLVWSPDRPGGWIFHCHMSVHVVPTEPEDGDERYNSMFQKPHHEHANNHAVEGMGGLLMATYIRPPEGWRPKELERREMRLFIGSDSARGGLSGRQFGYVLQEGDLEPAPDSVLLPGSPLILRKGEPTSIRVFNRTDEATQVHWHGVEIESYFDGVAGWSGYPDRLTPAIAPGDSFEIRVTPPRAGSFMYHTHINDLRQQGSGLYGAFIVLDEHETWDPETDRIFLFGESPFRSDEIPVLNGANPTEPITLRVGTTYRLRMMNITLNRPSTVVRLLRDGFPVRWLPIAKDGFDLPPAQRQPELAEHTIAVGETYDYHFTPRAPGDLALEVRTGGDFLLVAQVIHVVE